MQNLEHTEQVTPFQQCTKQLNGKENMLEDKVEQTHFSLFKLHKTHLGNHFS